MAFYKDENGREFRLIINFGTIEAVRERTGIDLLEPNAGSPSPLEVLSKPANLFDMLFNTVKYSNKDVDDDVIWESFDDMGAPAATSIFYSEWESFLRKRLGREDLAASVKKYLTTLMMAVKRATEKIEKLNPEEFVKTAEKSLFAATSGDSQA